MKWSTARFVALSGFLASTVSLTAMAGDSAKKAPAGIPLPTDWSHRHLIFSQPRTAEQAARLQRDIRYRQQQERYRVRPNAVLRGADSFDQQFGKRHPRRHWIPRRMHRDWSTSLGNGASVGAARFPAKYGFDSTTASCGHLPPPIPDYVIFATGVTGSATQGSIVAFTNLYAGCSGVGPVPGGFWSYNTGGQVNTSPVISLDGTQVAFIQINGGTSSLVLIKWLAFDGFVQTPTTLVSTTPALYAACSTLPCMTTFDLGATDTNSSVFYDYGTDTAWVGDDAGNLHQFTGVFLGTPAEVTGGGWPAPVGGALTSAVHDGGSGNTFVGDDGGLLYRVDSNGGVTASAQLDFGSGLTEGPVVDISAGTVYVFSSNDGAASAAVFQISTAFTAGDSGAEATVGAATALGTPLSDGAFDHNYIFSATTGGHLYVCGNLGANPRLYQIPIQGGLMGTPLAGPFLSTTSETPCSPLTDVYNATLTGAGLPQEWVFLSVPAAGIPDACGGFACVMNLKVTQWQPSFQYNLGQEVLDSNFNIEVAENSGQTSGTITPPWGPSTFDQTNDNGVHWRNQGPVLSFPANAPWQANTGYPGGSEVIDSFNDIEIAQLPGGTSGGTAPAWQLGEGSTVLDNDITWYNLGANPNAALQSPGGTSGIIIDNTTNTPGGSQIYYSTLSGGCAPGGTGGCAVQASQQDLN